MHKILHHADGSSHKIHLGGWKKQSHDPRDAAYAIKLHSAFTQAPSSCDNRPICSPVEDQGDLGSCTANMFAGLIESNEVKRSQGKTAGAVVSPTTSNVPTVETSNVVAHANGNLTFKTTVKPASSPTPTPTPSPTPAKLIDVSRLFEYYATRKIEQTVNEDSGASIRDAIKAGVLYGVADETTWPYDISKFTQNPPSAVWSAAATHKVTSYHAIADGDIETMKSTLAAGFLIGFGFEVYSYMMSQQMAQNGKLCVPKSSEYLEGGHAVALVGYDNNMAMPDGSKGAFLVRNSWGTGWGIGGYFWMAYNYVGNTRLASDFWVVQSSPI